MKVSVTERIEDKSMESVQEYARTGLPVGHLGADGPGFLEGLGADGLGFLGRLSLLSRLALLSVQSQDSYQSAQDQWATRAAREGLGGAGSGNSMAGAGIPEAKDLWRERGQYATATLC